MRTPVLFLLAIPIFLYADGPEDNIAEKVRPIPPEGIAVPEETSKSLREALAGLEKRISSLRNQKPHRELVGRYLPDVEICHKAVHDALTYSEFYKPGEFDFAQQLIDLGIKRANQLAGGNAPWTHETGFVLRGYRSKIDGSPQPYGLEIPANYSFDGTHPWRLDFWFHGRGEKLSELSFCQQRLAGKGGKISPTNAIVLHPYGRYSNANKFAGEADLFEALAHAEDDYRIDENRILVRGFSMGGAACWQFAVHYAGKWAAATPGAGFSETPDFLRTFQGETLNPTWWEKKLWRWYDATDWALNLSNCPTIAYSGELDRQKQAADMMVAAAEKEGIRLVHLIGPETAHAIHPDSLTEIETRLSNIVEFGRNPVPNTVHFVTYTLRYNTMLWVRVDRMTEHWEQARIDASITGSDEIEISTNGVEAFSLHFESGQCPLDVATTPTLKIDGTDYEAPKVWSDRSWEVYCSRSKQRGAQQGWVINSTLLDTPLPGQESTLTKRHGLQGPVDDAFTESFVFVSPSGKPQHDLAGEWTHSEQRRAAEHWRKQFRGNARVKSDSEINDDDIAAGNLILWGDPSSNSLIARVAKDLPISWSIESITVGGESYDAAHHILAMIFPNPLNPGRYVVLNSGFTYREYDYLNNARQTPKLPDWAVIDLREAPSTRYSGKVVAAGFFDENWELKPQPED